MGFNSLLLFKKPAGAPGRSNTNHGQADAKDAGVDWRPGDFDEDGRIDWIGNGVSTGPMPSTCTIHWSSTMVF